MFKLIAKISKFFAALLIFLNYLDDLTKFLDISAKFFPCERKLLLILYQIP